MTQTTSNPAQTFADRNADVLRDCPREHSFGVAPDAMIAAGCYVQREFGHTGYIVRLITGDMSGALWELSHSDGSSRRLWTDRWGNVGLVPEPGDDEARLGEALTFYREHYGPARREDMADALRRARCGNYSTLAELRALRFAGFDVNV